MSDITSVPFARPMVGEDEIAEVTAVLKSGWLTTGPRCKRFEEDFQTFMGGEVEAIAVNSCTAGLHLALEAIGITAKDEVIVPTLTFTATAEVVRYFGAKPVLVDCDPETLCLDITAVENAITDKIKAIMPVHYAGRACDMDALFALAKQHNLRIIEDAAHALPTEYNGELIGTLNSDITVFSFYANKTITTGEGGMLVTKDPALAKRCRVMRTHGIDRDAFDRFTAASEKPSWYYEIVAPGYKYNMPDMAAAVGIHQLKKTHQFQNMRKEIVDYYREHLAGLPLSMPPKEDNGDIHAWHLCVIQLDLSQLNITRNQFIEEMSHANIGTGVHYIPLHQHPYWRDTYHLNDEMFPVASALFQRMVTLPLFAGMTIAEADYVIAAIKNICQKHIKKSA